VSIPAARFGKRWHKARSVSTVEASGWRRILANLVVGIGEHYTHITDEIDFLQCVTNAAGRSEQGLKGVDLLRTSHFIKGIEDTLS